MTKLHGSWIWYELLTTDRAGAAAFYGPLLGWRFDNCENPAEYGFLANPDGGLTGGTAQLSEAMNQQGARSCWLGYIGVDDIDAAVKSIEAAGGQIRMPPMEIPQTGRIAMVTDCCGAPFYVMTPAGEMKGESTAFSADKNFGRCGWNELMAGDAENAAAFYTAQFGWSLPDAMDMGDLGKYQFVAQGETTIGAIMRKMPEVPVPMWNHYFWVPGIDAAAALITANGGTIINGPMEVPGGDWIVQGLDPQGSVFSLVGSK